MEKVIRICKDSFSPLVPRPHRRQPPVRLLLLQEDPPPLQGAPQRRRSPPPPGAATLSPEQIREKCGELTKGIESINTEVATYVEDLLVDRSRRIADIGLTPREIEIIRLSAEGLTAAEIAARTFLSVHTVNTHRQHIYAKMGVKNVADMLRKAGELGIL